MNEFRTRVRSVRFKNGCELRVLPSRRELASRRTAQRLRNDVDIAIESCRDDMAGFAITMWLADIEGTSNFARKRSISSAAFEIMTSSGSSKRPRLPYVTTSLRSGYNVLEGYLRALRRDPPRTFTQ
jgi:hypothetical protein